MGSVAGQYGMPEMEMASGMGRALRVRIGDHGGDAARRRQAPAEDRGEQCQKQKEEDADTGEQIPLFHRESEAPVRPFYRGTYAAARRIMPSRPTITKNESR